jgi:guanylate kinase
MTVGVITITGPSGSGKTTLSSCLVSLASHDFKPLIVPKFTTRAARDNEISSHELPHNEKVFVERIPTTCDLVYESYGVRYGLHMRSIFDAVSRGNTPIVVLNDIRTVEDVRTLLGPLVRSVFVFRSAPEYSHFQNLAQSRGALGKDDGWARFQKAYSIYRIYIENIHMFDHVALNVGSVDEMSLQASRIVAGLSQRISWPLVEEQQ